MSHFTIKELNSHNAEIMPEIEKNLIELIAKMDKIREAWGKPMIVTSGLRSQADQMRINPKAPKSKHLLGQAVDIQDKDGSLYKWCKNNEASLEAVGLWCEERQGAWQHFQSVPPKSGNRFFIP